MWEHMTFGQAGMWSSPYMLIFWVLLLVGAIVLGILIARTIPHRRDHHDDSHSLHRR